MGMIYGVIRVEMYGVSLHQNSGTGARTQTPLSFTISALVCGV